MIDGDNMAQIAVETIDCSEKFIAPYYQPQPDMCQPTCVKVVLDALSRQYNNAKIKLGLRTIAKLCEYRRGIGSPSDAVIDNLNRRLRKSKFEVASEVAPTSNIRLLQDILDGCCFPIVALSSKYFDKYEKKGYDIQEDTTYEHTVVIIKIDSKEEIIYFFDPWEKYAKKKLSIKEPPPNSLIYPTFIKLWDETNRWVIWVRPLKSPIRAAKGQKKLEEFRKRARGERHGDISR